MLRAAAAPAAAAALAAICTLPVDAQPAPHADPHLELFALVGCRHGLDVGVTSIGEIAWVVFATTDRYARMLAGHFIGISALLPTPGSRSASALAYWLAAPVPGRGQLDVGVGVGELRPAN